MVLLATMGKKYLKEVLVGPGLALLVVGVDVGHHHAVQGVVPPRVVLAEAELVDGVAGVEFLGAKGDEVVHVHPPGLERPPRRKVKIPGHLPPDFVLQRSVAWEPRAKNGCAGAEYYSLPPATRFCLATKRCLEKPNAGNDVLCAEWKFQATCYQALDCNKTLHRNQMD